MQQRRTLECEQILSVVRAMQFHLALTNVLLISPNTSKVRMFGTGASKSVTLIIVSQRQCLKSDIQACQ
ncbi:MAG: hypothetical protein EZS28_029082 [Streblomastix strix]|uniref:Uncharacterized protein n=1 Tax=Streblomastix strix TaxID=222440 RepID=A0A5J4UZZ3_9EUKA|nr:MAG: hypothetical protein EZS28_029082 [Streblomastix strix]